MELEGWTNDRLVADRVARLPKTEWVYGVDRRSLTGSVHLGPRGCRFSRLSSHCLRNAMIKSITASCPARMILFDPRRTEHARAAHGLGREQDGTVFASAASRTHSFFGNTSNTFATCALSDRIGGKRSSLLDLSTKVSTERIA
jgi:hypothetical protein